LIKIAVYAQLHINPAVSDSRMMKKRRRAYPASKSPPMEITAAAAEQKGSQLYGRIYRERKIAAEKEKAAVASFLMLFPPELYFSGSYYLFYGVWYQYFTSGKVCQSTME